MRRPDSDPADQSRSPRWMDGVGTVGREVNGDPFSTGVKHAVRRDEAEERRKGGEITSGPGSVPFVQNSSFSVWEVP